MNPWIVPAEPSPTAQIGAWADERLPSRDVSGIISFQGGCLEDYGAVEANEDLV
jgi:hypothetical protein